MGAHVLISQQDLAAGSQRQLFLSHVISSVTFLLGYCLYIVGVVVPAWRLEMGYVFGLWVRCDDQKCLHYFIGFTTYLSLVRSGVVFSLVFLTAAIIGLFLEMVIPNRRLAKAINVFAVLGEILASASLALYGCKTVMVQDKLPALAWGFAVTGTAVISLLIGSILRLMGSPETWGQDGCCLAPSHKSSLFISESSPSDLGKQNPITFSSNTESGRPHLSKSQQEKTTLLACFKKTKRGYMYSSVPSTGSSSLERGYRHYEEISFEDMPPPPLELLNSVNSSLPDSLPVYPDVQQPIFHTASQPLHEMANITLLQAQTRTLSSQRQTHSTRQHNQVSSDSSRRVPGHRSSGGQPAITPRHTVKPRRLNVAVSVEPQCFVARQQEVTTTTRSSLQQGTHVSAGVRYQTMPVKPTRKSSEHWHTPVNMASVT